MHTHETLLDKNTHSEDISFFQVQSFFFSVSCFLTITWLKYCSGFHTIFECLFRVCQCHSWKPLHYRRWSVYSPLPMQLLSKLISLMHYSFYITASLSTLLPPPLFCPVYCFSSFCYLYSSFLPSPPSPSPHFLTCCSPSSSFHLS